MPDSCFRTARGLVGMEKEFQRQSHAYGIWKQKKASQMKLSWMRKDVAVARGGAVNAQKVMRIHYSYIVMHGCYLSRIITHFQRPLHFASKVVVLFYSCSLIVLYMSDSFSQYAFD